MQDSYQRPEGRIAVSCFVRIATDRSGVCAGATLMFRNDFLKISIASVRVRPERRGHVDDFEMLGVGQWQNFGAASKDSR